MQTHFHASSKKVKIFFEDKEMEVPEGISVAAAMLSSHVGYTRITEKRKSKRAAYCQMGICFECIMHIDGKANQQACMIQVCEGMRIYRQNGIPDVTALPVDSLTEEKV